MRKISVIVNGLPGKMANAVAEAVAKSEDLKLLPVSLTGPEVEIKEIVISGITVKLFTPDKQLFLLGNHFPDIQVDFTHPSAIRDNVNFYTEMGTPFVLGTTGGDLDYISTKVKKTGINAVVAPNMAGEIVAFQMMMDWLASNFPGLFKDYNLTITESHQKTKADTSGTAKAMIKTFNRLGIPFTVDQIDKKRTEKDYYLRGIPEEHWGGHGYHTYSLSKKDGSVDFSFTHNVRGREAYVANTLSAIRYLFEKGHEPCSKGEVYSMADVLQKN